MASVWHKKNPGESCPEEFLIKVRRTAAIAFCVATNFYFLLAFVTMTTRQGIIISRSLVTKHVAVTT